MVFVHSFYWGQKLLSRVNWLKQGRNNVSFSFWFMAPCKSIVSFQLIPEFQSQTIIRQKNNVRTLKPDFKTIDLNRKVLNRRHFEPIPAHWLSFEPRWSNVTGISAGKQHGWCPSECTLAPGNPAANDITSSRKQSLKLWTISPFFPSSYPNTAHSCSSLVRRLQLTLGGGGLRLDPNGGRGRPGLTCWDGTRRPIRVQFPVTSKDVGQRR